MIEKHQEFAPYAYVYNNPLRFIDLFGLDTLLPDVSGRNIYLPDATENINYFSKNTVQGKETGNKYTVQKGNVKSFTIEGVTYNATFNKKTGKFTGYKGTNGEKYNQLEHLPIVIKENLQKGTSTSDLVSFSANLESTFIRGGNASWQINILFAGDNIDLFYSSSEAYTKGFGVDWGVNVTEGWYVGPKNKTSLTKQDVVGDFTYWQGNLVFGFGTYKGYDPTGKIIWRGQITGFGFGFGVSKGEGTIIIPE